MATVRGGAWKKFRRVRTGLAELRQAYVPKIYTRHFVKRGSGSKLKSVWYWRCASCEGGCKWSLKMKCPADVYTFEKISDGQKNSGHGAKSAMSGTLSGERATEETAAVLAVVVARGTAASREDISGALRTANLRPERQNAYFQSVV